MENANVVFHNGHWNGDYPMVHTVHRLKEDNGLVTVGGCLPDYKWEIGQRVDSNNNIVGAGIYSVEEVVEQRDHRGVFTNPQHKINSYFKVKLKKVN